MAKRQEIPSNKKISVSLNLEGWIWELVERIESNRSKFFRNLFLEKIKAELINEHVMTDMDGVTELLGEVYLNIIQYKRQLKSVITGRKPVRRVGLKKEEIKNGLSEDLKKKAISINMEHWIWEIAAKIAPNRSAFFKDLLLQKMKKELINANVVKENEVIGKQHAEAYIKIMAATIVNKKVS
ncbi:hypothetical protein QE429_003013 [Bacillus sp. SORGH_AS 510]|uniref:hypothetical protein n=1 Tax=Bacillus sp. SORGH_AS_0510 TaxID=3041771 RepID=UPI002786C04D|nr:hypothetical protein [Bacillus sp. SORGH_AS_0510]MDQ1146186.1 hypothetical protein [Bacillus sp. SORGH_AS_0510]